MVVMKHQFDNVESNALWSICMYVFVTYLGNIGPPFVVNFFELLFLFVCPTFSLNSEYALHTILHILLVKRSLVPYGALSCSIEYCLLLSF